MIIGLPKDRVSFLQHTDDFDVAYKREENLIQDIFGSDVVNVCHIGSTSIKGVDARPVIDILLVVKDVNKIASKLRKLNIIGYTFAESKFFKDGLFLEREVGELITHNLYIGNENSESVTDILNFKRYLDFHEIAIDEYNKIKGKLAQKYRDNCVKYNKKKVPFIKRTLKVANNEYKR